MEDVPEELQEALNKGKLTQDQLKELITLEANALGLTFKSTRPDLFPLML